MGFSGLVGGIDTTILPKLAEQPVQTLLTDRTADGPGQVGPTRGSGPPSTGGGWHRAGYRPHPRVGTFYRAPEVVSTQPFADAHVLAQPAFPDPKLVEPTSEPVEWPRTGQPHPRVGTVYRAPEVVSTQPFADAHVLAQPALSCPKLVEPTSKRQRAGRVETTVHTSENSRSGLLFSCRMVSTRTAPSSQPGSTSFRDDGFRFPAGRCGAVASDRFRAAGRSTVRQWCRPGGSVVC